METSIRNIEEKDLEEVYDINRLNTPHVSDISMDSLSWLFSRACFKKLVENDEGILGFLLCFFPGHPYKSLNYQWFSRHYDNFLYIDRIAVRKKAHRKGIGSLLYQEAAVFGTDSNSEYICCEVNIRPMNEISMRFHEKHNYIKVGEQDTEAGKKRVALLVKKLTRANP